MGYLGIDPTQALRLAHELRLSAGRVDAVEAAVAEAQLLADLTVPVHPLLEQVPHGPARSRTPHERAPQPNSRRGSGRTSGAILHRGQRGRSPHGIRFTSCPRITRSSALGAYPRSMTWASGRSSSICTEVGRHRLHHRSKRSSSIISRTAVAAVTIG